MVHIHETQRRGLSLSDIPRRVVPETALYHREKQPRPIELLSSGSVAMHVRLVRGGV